MKCEGRKEGIEKIAIRGNIGESGSLLYMHIYSGCALCIQFNCQSPGFVIKLGPHAAIG